MEPNYEWLLASSGHRVLTKKERGHLQKLFIDQKVKFVSLDTDKDVTPL